MKEFKDFLSEAKVDHRRLGQQGMFDVTDTGIPKKGQLVDYYDRNGDKHQGKVKSVKGVESMTLTNTSTGEDIKLTLIKP